MSHTKRLQPSAPIAKQPPDPAGEQSGDLQGLSDVAEADSESVRELAEEGQSYEAEVISGVENAASADDKPLRPRKRSEDDVPPEYADHEPDEPKE